MKRFSDRLALIAITLWVGGLWTIGYLAAPVLFSALPTDKAMAGMLAGKMFTLLAYVGMGCGFYLLIHRMTNFGTAALKHGFFWATLVMLLLVIAGHFGIQPILESLKNQALPKEVMETLFQDRFVRWHGIASIVYLIQSLLGLVLVLSPGK